MRRYQAGEVGWGAVTRRGEFVNGGRPLGKMGAWKRKVR